MRFSRERDVFISEMQQEAEAHGVTEQITDPPFEEQVRRFFSYRNGAPEDAIDAFEAYMGLFYMHSGEINPSSDTVYPGGPSIFCDSLAEVFSARIENGYRIIDCEGYAVAGVELLTIAGFQLVEYIDAVPIDQWFGIKHIIAYMRMPQGTRGFIYVSNAFIYRSLDLALMGVGFDPDRTRCGRGSTVREAADEAYWIQVNARINMTRGFLHRHIPFL